MVISRIRRDLRVDSGNECSQGLVVHVKPLDVACHSRNAAGVKAEKQPSRVSDVLFWIFDTSPAREYSTLVAEA